MDTVAQRLVNNEMDSALDMRSSVIGNILAQNPKITTHTGNKSPFGYLDWWPNSLWMNTQFAPYSDPRVRRAVSLAINRDQINDVVYEGAKIATIYPFPLYPGLKAFVELARREGAGGQVSARQIRSRRKRQADDGGGFCQKQRRSMGEERKNPGCYDLRVRRHP